MLSKCANPLCSTPLIYLREGKIFMMEDRSGPKARSEGLGPVLVKAKPSHRVEHFWLCGPCSVALTLTPHERGAEVVPKSGSARERRAYAAAAS